MKLIEGNLEYKFSDEDELTKFKLINENIENVNV